MKEFVNAKNIKYLYKLKMLKKITLYYCTQEIFEEIALLPSSVFLIVINSSKYEFIDKYVKTSNTNICIFKYYLEAFLTENPE